MTIKNLYPKARPHIIYNVINGRPELPAQASFSRASEATYVDRAGIIRTAGDDEPRFNYDPETGEFLGLMLEEELQNSALQSKSYLGWTTVGIMNPSPTDNAAIAPDGTLTAWELPATVTSSNAMQCNLPELTDYGMLSFFIKRGTASGSSSVFYAATGNYNSSTYWANKIFNFDTEETFGGYKSIKYPNGWYRLYKLCGSGGSSNAFVLNTKVNDAADIAAGRAGSNGAFMWGTQLERSVRPLDAPSSFTASTASNTNQLPPFQRATDAFSLTTSSDFDNGFSLLLDSNTTTDDFIYKIKAGGSTIAELNNDNGTLDWVIDGTSAATSDPPQYPQIGAIQPGRVRTVSSFGAAGDGDQTNYLYTESLSFPTVAEPAVGADELEFGPGQTVKAVYVWDGQLSNTEAVSVIKGEYNIILDEPIQADTYSFVYNTDPTNVGEASITLPYIVPTVSMRVYWGDTTSDRYEPGVTPSHAYPYPGQYRIQIEADDGFDAVRLADVNNSIQRVDQWAPQHRVGATGDGFTGDDLALMLANQVYCTSVPASEYTNITSLVNAFYNCQSIDPNGWDWVPTDCQQVTTLNGAFRAISKLVRTQAESTTFPQLITGPSLTSISACFPYGPEGWVTAGGNPTYQPFTDTSNVTNFSNAFYSSGLNQLTIDTQSATTLNGAFAGNNWTTSPFFNAPNCTNFEGIFRNCTQMTTMNPSIANSTYSNGTNFQSAWRDCSALTSFPLIDTSSGTNFRQAWRSCSALTSFPLIDTSSATSLSYTWSECTNLASIPLIDTSNVASMEGAWRFCSSLTSFPLIDTSKATHLGGTWWGCSLTSVPLIDTSSCTNFSYTWNSNDFTTFPALDLSSGTDFRNMVNSCLNLAGFPANMFDTTGTLRSDAFYYGFRNCALTAQSIENILVSLDTNGQSNIELTIDGGTNAGQSTWTTAANTAYTNLINKGWTITSNP
jgi:hypothetical protein